MQQTKNFRSPELPYGFYVDSSDAIASRGILRVHLHGLVRPECQAFRHYFLSRENVSCGLNLKRDSASPRFWMNASEL